ncbi:MAG TPA: hypothetical protein PLX89_27390, partial [Verrucomicrobiota bacterium]|nr:hypothetical protein [Verrucomicrobiota bacterium]
AEAQSQSWNTVEYHGFGPNSPIPLITIQATTLELRLSGKLSPPSPELYGANSPPVPLVVDENSGPISGPTLERPSASVADRLAVANMLGEPVPEGIRDVHFSTDGPLAPEPKFFLRFRADREEVLLLIARGGFVESDREFTAFFREGPPWWRSEEGTRLVHYRRDQHPSNCVVEGLWWDAFRGDVFYFRSCP